eukprot:m.476608 g.476608  ORF g.476608 m.476608 type:complete len:365 (-) comp20589_c0_seq1:166-1260(-)
MPAPIERLSTATASAVVAAVGGLEASAVLPTPRPFASSTGTFVAPAPKHEGFVGVGTDNANAFVSLVSDHHHDHPMTTTTTSTAAITAHPSETLTDDDARFLAELVSNDNDFGLLPQRNHFDHQQHHQLAFYDQAAQTTVPAVFATPPSLSFDECLDVFAGVGGVGAGGAGDLPDFHTPDIDLCALQECPTPVAMDTTTLMPAPTTATTTAMAEPHHRPLPPRRSSSLATALVVSVQPRKTTASAVAAATAPTAKVTSIVNKKMTKKNKTKTRPAPLPRQRRPKRFVPDHEKTPEYLAFRKLNTERARKSREKAKQRKAELERLQAQADARNGVLVDQVTDLRNALRDLRQTVRARLAGLATGR